MKLIFLLILTLSTLLQAQKSDFSLIIHKPFDAALFDVTEDYDRGITAVGFSKNYKQATNSSRTYNDPFEYLKSVAGTHGSQMQLIKIDNSAKVLLSKTFNFSKFNEAIAVVKTPANGYFIGGYTLDGSLLIAKLDAQAHTLWSKTFGTQNYDRMNNLILMSDGGVLAVGSSITSRATTDNIFESGLGNNDIFLTRFSKDGYMLWSKKYGTMYDDQGIDAVEARDGSIMVVSTTSFQKNRDVSLMRVTENGDRIWLKHYTKDAKTDDTIIPTRIIRLKDNNFVVALSQYNDMQKEHIRIIKFDLYENILIDKEIFTTYPSGINDIKEYSDGTFIAVGYVKDAYNTDALAIILDANLVMLQQEHYGKNNYDLFHGVTILHNSQAAVVGVHTDENSQETNMWITKLNHDATMVQLSTNTSSFYEKLCALFDEEIKAKKLTIKEDLTINIIDKSLLFEVGQYRLNSKQSQFLEKFSPKLLSFLFKNRDLIQRVEINGHTSSEWKNTNFSQSYLNNEKLSLNRAYEVMSFIFKSSSNRVQQWLTTVLKGSGNSYTEKIMFNEKEDKRESRRVSFKIILK